MYKIVNVLERMDIFEDAVDYFWKQWGDESNRNFYVDSIKHSSITGIPSFYIALKDNEIVASYSLMMNDMISRQDLTPWFACLLVSPEERGVKLGAVLQRHAIKRAKRKGYKKLYLITNLDNYYENNGWEYFAKGYLESGKEKKLYQISLP